MVNADPDELAITVNVSLALAAVMSCIDFSKRPKIVLSELDFPTDGHVALAHRRRGAEVVFLKSPDGLTIPLDAYREAIDERTAIVLVNRVLYRTSALLDAKEICRMAREAGAWSLVATRAKGTDPGQTEKASPPRLEQGQFSPTPSQWATLTVEAVTEQVFRTKIP